MFCMKCGSEIPEGGAFCTKCGTKVQETQPIPSHKMSVTLEKPVGVSDVQSQTEEQFKQETVQQITQQPVIPVQETASNHDLSVSADVQQTTGLDSVPSNTETTAAMHDTLMEKIVSKNVAYYKRRFEELRQGGRNRINWAAFFLGLLHASYRGCWKAWVQAVWRPFAFSFIGGFIVMLLMFFDWKFSFLFIILGFATNIWIFIVSILYAKRFNRIYMEHVEKKIANGNAKADPSAKRVVLAWLALTAFVTCIYIVSFIASIPLLGSVFNDIDFDDIDLNDFLEESIELTEQLPEEFPLQASNAQLTEPTVQASPFLKDYTGSWKVDRYNNYIDGYVGFYLEEYQGQLYLTVGAVWNQGDRLTTISDVQLELSSDGTSGGAPYEDDRGNIGDVMLFIENGIPYLTVTVRGDHQYGIEMEYERCSKQEDQYTEMDATEISEGNLPYWFYWFDAMQTFSNEIYTMEDLAKRTIGEAYLWPSDFMEISEGYLNEVTQVEVAIIRNEIFARHGYIFSNPKWDAFFRTASWYVPNPNYSESMLNQMEKKNLKIITEYEKARGWK